MKNQTKLVIVFFLLLFPFISVSSNAQQDPPHVLCCETIFIAGEKLGVVNSMVEWAYPSSRRPIIQHLWEAGDTIEIANTLCSKENEAWPTYRGKHAESDKWCYKVARNEVRLDEFLRWIEQLRVGWANHLSPQFMRDSGIDKGLARETCSRYYFKIGFDLGYAFHAFQVAAQMGDTDLRKKVMYKAHLHMLWARKAIDGENLSLKALQVVSGYCVALWRVPEIINPLDRLLNSFPSQVLSLNTTSLIWDVISDIRRALRVGIPARNVQRCPGDGNLPRTEKGRRYFRDRHLRDPKGLKKILDEFKDEAGIPWSGNLTGTWSCSDNGTYVIKHSGNTVTWTGTSPDGGKHWQHDFSGRIEGGYIIGRFRDRATGMMRNEGDLVIKIEGPDRMVKVAEYKGIRSHPQFGGSVWTRKE